jgi:hypothetical protein
MMYFERNANTAPSNEFSFLLRIPMTSPFLFKIGLPLLPLLAGIVIWQLRVSPLYPVFAAIYPSP